MTSKRYPTNVLAQAAGILAACKQINPDMTLGMLTQAAFADDMAQTKALQKQLEDLELKMIKLRTKRDQQLLDIWDVVKRTRASVKGAYGDDSAAYKMVGGTRASERKHTVRHQPPEGTS